MIRIKKIQKWYKQKRTITLTNKQICNLATFLRVFLCLGDGDIQKYQYPDVNNSTEFPELQKEEIEDIITLLETAETNRNRGYQRRKTHQMS